MPTPKKERFSVKKFSKDIEEANSDTIETFSMQCLKCLEVKLISDFIFTKSGNLECSECSLPEIKIHTGKKPKNKK